MFNSLKPAIRKILNSYTQRVCRLEYENQNFFRFNERPAEFSFVFRKLAEIYPRTILDVGTGATALPHLMRNCGHLVTAIDNVRDYWPSGMVNRHYYVINDDITNTQLKEKYDFITCISVLEHIQNPDAALNSMVSLLNPGGHLALTFPYNEKEYVRNVYDLEGSSYGQNSPYITQSFSRSELNKWIQENNVEILDQEYWQYWSGIHWTVGSQIIPPKKSDRQKKHQLTCILFKKS